MTPNTGFDGCMYAAQWNNIFPIRMIFEEPKNPFVYMEPAGKISGCELNGHNIGDINTLG